MAVSLLDVVGSTAVSGTTFEIPVDVDVPRSSRETARHVYVFLKCSGVNPEPVVITDDAVDPASPYRRCEWFPTNPGNAYYGVVPGSGGLWVVQAAIVLKRLEIGDTISGTLGDDTVEEAWAVAFEGMNADTTVSFLDLETLTRRGNARATNLDDSSHSDFGITIDPTFYDAGGGPGDDGLTWTTEVDRTARERSDTFHNHPYTWETGDGGKALTLAAVHSAPAVTGYTWENIDMVTVLDSVTSGGPLFALGIIDVDDGNANPAVGGYWTGPASSPTAVPSQAQAFALRPGDGPAACQVIAEGEVIFQQGEPIADEPDFEAFNPATAGRVSFGRGT